MKRALFFVYLLIMLSSFTCQAQQLNKAQREAFILGTLNDYLGRRGDPGFASVVDNYEPGEDVIVRVIDSLLYLDYRRSEYEAIPINLPKYGVTAFEICSGAVANRLNRYYTFKPSGGFTAIDNTVINYGILTDSMLVTDEQKMAFLAGMYVRFSRSENGAFKVNIANSTSKLKLCKKLFEYFGSSAHLKIWRGNVPTGMQLSFRPRGVLKKFLANFTPVAKRVSEVYSGVENKIFSSSGSSE